MAIMQMTSVAMWKTTVFLGLLATLLALEAWRPRRVVPSNWSRRTRNLALIALSTILLRILFPLGAVGFAAAWHGGLLRHIGLPVALEVLISFVLLDLAIYWQHRAFHYWPLLWRAHRVHHSDVGFDVSLGVRFHPLEIIPSFAFKLLIVALLGVTPAVIAAYEASLLGFSLLTHANVALPAAIERVLRVVFVTPDWHRVHHSIHRDETDSNFGNILSIWDRWFGTARERPRENLAAMTIGLPSFRDSEAQRLGALLIQPFLRESDGSSQEELPHA